VLRAIPLSVQNNINKRFCMLHLHEVHTFVRQSASQLSKYVHVSTLTMILHLWIPKINFSRRCSIHRTFMYPEHSATCSKEPTATHWRKQCHSVNRLRRHNKIYYFQTPVVTVRTARFTVHKFYVLPTQCVYVFCVDLRRNSDYFPIQH
jgi:hypothetical protein